MMKLFSFVLVMVLFTSCGVDTSSSTQDSIATEQDSPPDNLGGSLVDLNPITDTNNTVPDKGTGSGGGTGTPTTPNPDHSQDNSVFDISNAVYDKYACTLGDINNGFTNNIIKDTSNDYLGFVDEEDGLGVNSRYSFNIDALKTEVALFYYDLLIDRSMDVVSIVSDNYTISIDTAWADNNKKILYVRTPKDGNDLYGCYRYDVSSIDINRNVIITKVYSLKE